jgi:3-deoxy-D-manno-octulosonic-acid transferase
MAVSREGEEAALLDAWEAQQQVFAARPSAQRPVLLIVPRHPQRFDAVAELVASKGLRLVRRSAWRDALPAQAQTADVWLGDTLREMPLYYGLADVALLGGSFAPLGGQNLIEAAACGCPLIIGPHTFNFADAAERAVAAGAAVRVGEIGEALALTARWLDDTVALAARGQAAAAFAAHHRGAAERMAAAISALL